MPTPFGRNITVDGASLPRGRRRGYEAAVVQELTALMVFRTGAALVHELWGQAPRRVRITPWPLRELNADAAPADNEAAMAPGAVPHDARGRAHPEWGRGTGRGSSATLRYSPDRFRTDTRLHALENARSPVPLLTLWKELGGVHPSAPGSDREEILLHELVHALGFLCGRDTGSVPMGSGWDNEDEFRAILVADILASERGRPLRHLHAWGVLLAHPETWERNPALPGYLSRFTQALPGLAARLGDIDTDFNPFRSAYGRTEAMREPRPAPEPY